MKDKTTADPQPTLDEVKENFEQAIQMGTDTEAMIHEFCDKMQIPFENFIRGLFGFSADTEPVQTA